MFSLIKKKKYLKEDEILNIQNNVKNLVKECVDFAESSSFPEPADLYKNIYDGPYNFIRD